MYESNLWSPNFNYLPFDGDQSLIDRRQIYHVNDYIVEILKNG